MFRRIATILPVFLFASAILIISVLRSASINYAFSQPPETGKAVNGEEVQEIQYFFPYPGRILPDHPLWSVKVFRDKVWLLVTTNSLKKAELLLLCADKRLAAAQVLFERDKPELAVSTITKAEKYLEEAVNQEKIAREKGIDTASFLDRLALATLKHRQRLEEMILIAPEDAKPVLVETTNYPKQLFEQTRGGLIELGHPVPENPFEE